MNAVKAASVILAAAVILTGCGKEERAEADRLAKLLVETKAGYAKANAIEKEFVGNARAWCGGLAEKGAGRGAELEQNTIVAAELAKSVAAIGGQLGEMRVAVSAPALQKEFTRGVRSELIAQLTARQRALQDLRALLDESAKQLAAYKSNKAYAGDAYPGEIAKLSSILQAYKAPPDVVETALASLREKYNIQP